MRNCTILAQACVEDLIFLLKWLMLIFNFCVSTVSIVERVINKTKPSFMQICVYLISFVRGMQDVYQHHIRRPGRLPVMVRRPKGALKIFLEHSLVPIYTTWENYKQDRLFQTRSKLQSHFSWKSFFWYLKDTLNIITIWRELLGLTGMYSFHLILITWWGKIHPDTNITSTIFI